jgi:hypothetical protein
LPEGVLQLDFDYDFKTDIALAGAGGVRLYRQHTPATFTDVTAETKLPQSVLNGRYRGAWAVDIEADGDLDIVLGADEGAPTVLQNNGDGTFAAIAPFEGVSGLRQFAWVDIDRDGEPDAALIDGAGRLHVFQNERQGRFRERSIANGLESSRRSPSRTPITTACSTCLRCATTGRSCASPTRMKGANSMSPKLACARCEGIARRRSATPRRRSRQ